MKGSEFNWPIFFLTYKNGLTAYHITQFPHTSAMQAFHPEKGEKLQIKSPYYSCELQK